MIKTLKEFCSPGNRRYVMERPWSVGQYSYATDGRVAVRTGRLPDVEEMRDTERLAVMIDGWIRTGDTDDKVVMPVIDPPKLEREHCLTCDGRGTDHDCPDCQCECRDCGGTGWTEPRVIVSFCGSDVTFAHWRKIARLPGVKMARVENRSTHVSFVFDGGSGVVGTVRKREPGDVIVVAELTKK